MNQPNTIYEYITHEENAFAVPIEVVAGWDWNLKEHVRLTTLYKNSQFSEGNTRSLRDHKPFKNIMKPILDLQRHATGFDVKDIQLYVDSRKQYHKSFLVKKYHEKWAREHGLDTCIDHMVETYVDYGGVLLKKTTDSVPEVVPWQSIAFCDQTDVLSLPIGLKHFFSPDQLLDMAKKGWGDESNGATASLEEVIRLSENVKKIDKVKGQQTQTPGKYIEVYEVHGMFPKHYLEGVANEYEMQVHIVCFYTKENNEREGLTLFAGRERKLPFKMIKRDPIHGRALGFGGAEELFEPQVWINYDMIRLKELLDGAAKVIYKTTDTTFGARNKIKDMQTEEIVTLAEGTDIAQLDTTPRSVRIFENAVEQWEAHAQQVGSANDALLGVPPTAGTPFKLQELVVQTGSSSHNYRRGQLATFWEEVEQDWIIPHLAREITKGQEFLAELDFEELQQVVNAVIDTKVFEFKKERILNGEIITDEEVEEEKQRVREEFMKGGNKRFLELLKEELEDAPLSVKVNIAGKQDDLNTKVDKLVNILRQVISTPQMLQIPQFADLFNQIIEWSGLSPIDFGSMRYEMEKMQQQQLAAQQQQLPQQPLPQLSASSV